MGEVLAPQPRAFALLRMATSLAPFARGSSGDKVTVPLDAAPRGFRQTSVIGDPGWCV